VSLLDEAMKKYMRQLTSQGTPFSYRDFLSFNVEDKNYKMKHGTFRNKISKLVKVGEVEPYIWSGQMYYIINGLGFVKSKRSHHPSGVSLNQSLSSSVYENLSSEPENYNINQNTIIQTLLGYVLPLLPPSLFYIHNLHLHLKISSGIYNRIGIEKIQNKNRGKQYSTMIGKARVVYTFYPKGAVNIELKCTDNPFRVESMDDYNNLLLFFKSLRETLFKFLHDTQDIVIAVVPVIEDWYLTEYDINKDIKLDDQSLHIAAVKIQIKYHLHLFRIYIKSIGKNKFCRIEENRKQKNKNPIEVINEIFSPFEKIEKEIVQNSRILGDLQKRLQMVGDSDL
jgi:hypothetical protein